MRIGFMGLGRLGLPVALAIESRGHEVVGCDPAPHVGEILRTRRVPYREGLVAEHLPSSRIDLQPLDEVVKRSEIVFVTIQTPHGPRHEGITRLPEDRQDFDYSFLRTGIAQLSSAIEKLGEDRIVVVVSTVLPGTIRREVKPLLCRGAKLCYNPSFIAMGTAMQDFLAPQFVLFGVDDEHAAEMAAGFYRTIHDAPFYRTSLENAELIKVVYNTFISMKISFATTVMQMCQHLPGTCVDEVMAGLALDHDRILSMKYLGGGMGDGGACHPRDNIALSHLARSLGLPFDLFGQIMLQRERHTDWLGGIMEEHAKGRPFVILGTTFKPEADLTTGSPSILLKNILEERGHEVLAWDPHVGGDPPPRGRSCCYFVGTRHPELATYPFEPGSVVIDPWRFVEDREGVTVIRVGDRRAG